MELLTKMDIQSIDFINVILKFYSRISFDDSQRDILKQLSKTSEFKRLIKLLSSIETKDIDTILQRLNLLLDNYQSNTIDELDFDEKQQAIDFKNQCEQQGEELRQLKKLFNEKEIALLNANKKIEKLKYLLNNQCKTTNVEHSIEISNDSNNLKDLNGLVLHSLDSEQQNQDEPLSPCEGSNVVISTKDDSPFEQLPSAQPSKKLFGIKIPFL